MNKTIQRQVAAGIILLTQTLLPQHDASAQAALTKRTVAFTYAAKFVCGERKEGDATSTPEVMSGRYATNINVHNNSGNTVQFRKKLIVLHTGDEKPYEPKVLGMYSLRPDQAMAADCRDLGASGAFTEGFVVLELLAPLEPIKKVDDPFDVVAVYTSRVAVSAAAIDVLTVPVKRNSYTIVVQ